MTGETEEEALANAKKHGIEVHGYTEETWNEEISKNKEHFRSLIKQTQDVQHHFFISFVRSIQSNQSAVAVEYKQ